MFEDCHLRIGAAPFTSCMPLSAQLLSSLYALPHFIEKPMRNALDAFDEATPWAESYAIAPEQTASAVSAALRRLMMATSDLEPTSIKAHGLAEGTRARLHLEALGNLWFAHPDILPSDLAALKAFLTSTAGDALQPLAVVWDASRSDLTLLERTVLERLEDHHGKLSDEDPDRLRLAVVRRARAASPATLLGRVQRGLLDADAPAAPRDDSLAVLSVRDSLTECEAAAAIIQRWLAEDQSLKPSDIGLIIPPNSEYGLYLADSLQKAGLSASSLPVASEQIEADVPKLLLERIRAIAPFLQTAAWTVERNMLEAEIIKSANHWSQVLQSLGAEIIGNEFWLAGSLFDHPIHGKADCLLRLPNGQPVVVDYKKSSSGNRRDRLQKGWDLQVDLYRRMNVRIDERSGEGVIKISEILTSWPMPPAVAYHTLNDGNLLLNGVDDLDNPDVERVGGDIAENAVTLISARFKALKAGRLETNTTADAKLFQKSAALST